MSRRDRPRDSIRTRTTAYPILIVLTGLVVTMTAPIELLYAIRSGVRSPGLAAYIAGPGILVICVDVFGTRLMPRLEARRLLLGGLVLFAVGISLLATAGSFAQLVTARATEGLASGVILGSSLQAALRVNAHGERALITFNSSFLLGSALGSPLGGLIAAQFAGSAGYRIAFGVCAVAAVLVAVAVRVTLPRLPAAMSDTRPAWGLPRLPAVRGIRWAMLLGMLNDLLRGGLIMTVIPLAGRERHLSPATIGCAIGLVLGVEIILLRTVAGRLLARFEMVRGLSCALVLGAGLCLVLPHARSGAAFLICAGLLGVLAAATAIVPPLLLVALSGDDKSAGLASYRISCGLGALIGQTGAGVASTQIGTGAVLHVFVGVLVVAILVAARVRARVQEHEATPRGLGLGAAA